MKQKKKKSNWHSTQTNVSGGEETPTFPIYVIVGCDYTERREKIDGSGSIKKHDDKNGCGGSRTPRRG
jgi:hypothetical protein